MPAKTTLFDQRAKSLHDFGTAFCNFVSFNPQGRLLALGGFGNLAGTLEIYDRRTLTKVTSIDAANTSHCEWSPDGRFLLTATLSPRLRVDNGIKIWHCTGPLVHIQLIDELYQASWRPAFIDAVPQFPQNIPPAPAPSPSVQEHASVAKPAPVRAAVAYRPPGARGLEASSAYKRDEGAPSGSSTPNGRYSRSPAPGRQRTRRHVPGAPTSPSPIRSPEPEKRGRKGKGKKDKDGSKKEPKEPATPASPNGRPSLEIQVNGKASNGATSPTNGSVPQTPGAEGSNLDPIAKKVRNLNKKVRLLSLQCAPLYEVDIDHFSADVTAQSNRRTER